MAEIKLTYDARNPIAKKTLEFILSLGVFTQSDESAISKSIREAKKGKVNTYENVDDFFNKVLK